MIKTGELETFKRGGSRYIPVAAINDYIARSLAANKARTDAGVQVGNRLGKNQVEQRISTYVVTSGRPLCQQADIRSGGGGKP